MYTVRKLLAAEVTFSLEWTPEQESYHGHFEYDTPEENAEAEHWITGQLMRGNEWAWFCAKVTASWNGIEAADYLGGCSYESEANFRECCYAYMCEQALDQLNTQIAEQFAALAPLVQHKGA